MVERTVINTSLTHLSIVYTRLYTLMQSYAWQVRLSWRSGFIGKQLRTVWCLLHRDLYLCMLRNTITRSKCRTPASAMYCSLGKPAAPSGGKSWTRDEGWEDKMGLEGSGSWTEASLTNVMLSLFPSLSNQGAQSMQGTSDLRFPRSSRHKTHIRHPLSQDSLLAGSTCVQSRWLYWKQVRHRFSCGGGRSYLLISEKRSQEGRLAHALASWCNLNLVTTTLDYI